MKDKKTITISQEIYREFMDLDLMSLHGDSFEDRLKDIVESENTTLYPLTRCWNCKSKQIAAGRPIVEDRNILLHVDCQTCEATWVEIYTYSHFERTE